MTLPQGWAETTLREVAETRLGKMLDAAKNKGEPVPYLRNVNVRWGSFDLYDLMELKVTDDELTELSVRDGDLFVCEGGEPGRCAVWRGGPRRLVFQKALHRVRGLGGVEPDYLAKFLTFAATHQQFDDLLTGTTIKHLPQVALQKLGLPLPPLAEQRRIVAKLDALTARLARARTELDRVSVLAANLRKEALRNAFGHGAATVPVGELITDIRYGTTKKCDYGGGAVPVLRIPNVQGGRIDLTDMKSADFDAKELAKLLLRYGDILVIRSNGSLDLVGRSAIVDDSAAGMLFAGYLIRMRVEPAKCLPEYLHHFLQSPVARDTIMMAAKSTSGVNNVNAQQLQALAVPLPDLLTQRTLIDQIEQSFARADRFEAEATRARALLDRLESALLAKAFRGELVPQDPHEEPAQVLLDRIRQQRAAAPKAKRGRKAKVAG